MNKEFENPLVSIIIPVYNGSNYLSQAIESALNQTYKNIEILVINDGSCDNGATEKIALSYSDRIRYFRKINGGVASALNLGVSKMRGEYFSWLSHDDLYLPTKIESQISAIQEIEEKFFVLFGGYTTIDSHGKKIKSFRLPESIYSDVNYLIAIDTRYTLNGCTTLIPKVLFTHFGCFDEKLRYVQDYEFWFRLARVVPFYYIDENNILSRTHPDQESQANNTKASLESDNFHYYAINQLIQSKTEISSELISNYIHNAIIYKNSNYKLTYIAMMDYLFHLSKEDLKILELCTKELRFFSDTSRYLSAFNKNKEKERILIFNNVWYIGGIERVIKNLTDNFSNDYDIFILIGESDKKKGFKLSNGITMIFIPDDSIEIELDISILCRILEIDIFIGNPNLLETLMPVYKTLRAIGTKTIAFNHYSYFLPFSYERLRQLAEIRLKSLSYADLAIWPSSFSTFVYSQFNNNGIAIPNPNSYDSIDLNNSKSGNYILCIGRFYDNVKRIDLILLAFKEMYLRNQDLILQIVGEVNFEYFLIDYDMTLFQFIKKLCIPKGNLNFIGEVEDPSPYYQNSSVLISASVSEGFGLVIAEALCFGLPVVAFEYSGISELVLNNYNGFVISKNNYKLMSEKVLSLIQNKTMLEEFSSNSVSHSRKFNKLKIMKDWKLIFSKLLSNNPGFVDSLRENIQYYDFDHNLYKQLMMNEYESHLVFREPKLQEKNLLNNRLSQIKRVIVHIRDRGLIYTSKKILERLKKTK